MTHEEIMKRKDEINREIDALTKELHELEQQNEGYFIGVLAYGNYDYWDEMHHILGKCTEETAKAWLDAQMAKDDNIQELDSKVFKVDEETYNDYCKWEAYQKVIDVIRSKNDVLRDDPATRAFESELKRRIDDICPVTYPSFMHIATE